MPAQQYDPYSGYYYNWMRDYDPYTGRYIQADPLGLGGGLSRYTYVGANPLTRSDPRGLAQRDIDIAWLVARQSFSDLGSVDAAQPLPTLPEDGGLAGTYDPWIGVIEVNAIYANQNLSDLRLDSLLDTVIHELLHAAGGPGDPSVIDTIGSTRKPSVELKPFGLNT